MKKIASGVSILFIFLISGLSAIQEDQFYHFQGTVTHSQGNMPPVGNDISLTFTVDTKDHITTGRATFRAGVEGGSVILWNGPVKIEQSGWINVFGFRKGWTLDCYTPGHGKLDDGNGNEITFDLEKLQR